MSVINFPVGSTIIGRKQKSLTANPVGVPWWGIQDLQLVGNAQGTTGTGFITPPSAWDVVKFGPNHTVLPGLVKVKKCSRKMKLDRKEMPGSDFETQVFQGWGVVEFDFDLILWTQPQLAMLQSALAYFFPGAGDPPAQNQALTVTTVASSSNIVNPNTNSSTGPQATQQIQTSPDVRNRPPIPVKLQHPALQLHGVDTVVFEWMDGPVQRSEKEPDIFVVHFKTVQYRPAKPTKTKKLTSANPVGTPVGQIPQGGVGVLQPQFLPAAQSSNQSPSTSGGADPFGTQQYSNFSFTDGQGPSL